MATVRHRESGEYSGGARKHPLTDVPPPIIPTDEWRDRMVVETKVKKTRPAGGAGGSFVVGVVAEGGFEPPTKGL